MSFQCVRLARAFRVHIGSCTRVQYCSDWQEVGVGRLVNAIADR